MKNKWTLVPPEAMDDVVSVLTTGADKHGDFGWEDRTADEYVDAAMRHISEYRKGVTADAETGKPPLAHAAADLLIAAAIEGLEPETLGVNAKDLLYFDTFGATEDLPDWAQWTATNMDGQMYVYEREPSKSVEGWYPGTLNNYRLISCTSPTPDWASSKRRIKR